MPLGLLSVLGPIADALVMVGVLKESSGRDAKTRVELRTAGTLLQRAMAREQCQLAEAEATHLGESAARLKVILGASEVENVRTNNKLGELASALEAAAPKLRSGHLGFSACFALLSRIRECSADSRSK
ncbi:MAG TPA: hypothetical protein PLA97_20020 [Rubrivivax sp.]|nr:hypothetical protein [Rubrivivax sp.]